LLTSGTRDAPERQRTLRATVEWSHQLLGTAEQALFARLAVFAGSFELEAAEVVCSADLDDLQSLVDKSLLRHAAEGRFFMLVTIRELALEQLRDADDVAALRRRHDDYFLGVAEELNARERLSGPRDLSPRSLARFEREQPNFRAALAGLLRDERRDEVLRLGSALRGFWLVRTQYPDALEWLEHAPLDDVSQPAESRAAALASAGMIAFYVLDDVDRADALWQAGLELRRAQDDPGELAAALSRVASIAWRRGDFEGALALHRQAEVLFEQAGDHGSRLNELHYIGEAERDRGDFDEGQRLLEETASLARALGRDGQLINTTHSLGDLFLDRRDPHAALGRYRESLDLAVAADNRRSQVYCIAGIACALVQTGADATAARVWAIAQDQERQLGFRMLLNERRRYERLMATAHAEPARVNGGELTLAEAVAEARRYLPG
jgi:non-specific serine/threonine protein kinase